MRRVMRFHPILLIGIVTSVLMWTSPVFIPDYDEGVIGSIVFVSSMIVSAPFMAVAAILRIIPPPELLRTILVQVGGVGVYLLIDIWIFRWTKASTPSAG